MVESLFKSFLATRLEGTLLSRLGASDSFFKSNAQRFVALNERLKVLGKYAESLPASKGPLLVDRNHVTGRITAPSPDFLFHGLEVPPSDAEMKRLLKYDDIRRKSLLRGRNPLPSEFSPASSKNHVQEKRVFKGVLFSGAPFGGVLDLSDADQDRLGGALVEASLRADADPQRARETGFAAVRYMMESFRMKELFSSQRPPARMEILSAVLDGFDEFFRKRNVDTFERLRVESFRRADLDPTPCFTAAPQTTFVTTEAPSARRCVRCHRIGEAPGSYVANLDKWRRALESRDPEERADAVEWLDTISRRVLDEKDMPPSKTLEGKDFFGSGPGRELIQFLEAQKSRRPHAQ